ncbi:DNA mismatch repair protein MutT [Paracoccus gahaiensis]|uniref:DNA mismatch repair protein MutT n=1 Tax=Paracoccus gahaiensis TaxID=1706839 RepID=A0A4U0REI1_9RHOB|nr:DNA mismatch repair protein MutT [Paracoccus gahaiensis]TJZ93799.1 DNA mismatch repair protein MutT [Paracoccus gahaiensis]
MPIRDAATVLVLRRDDKGPSVLMGMRGAAAAFMPSKFVFPGGAVDPGDAQVALARPLDPVCRHRLQLEAGLSPEAIAAAALRELAEETGLLIGQPGSAPCPWPGHAAAGLVPDAAPLVYLFRAITPPGRPRRFDAHFFVTDATAIAGDPDDFSAACDELSHLHWVPLAQVRQLDLPFITEVVLAELAELIDGLPADRPLPRPDTVPFFDNRGPAPVFRQIA